MVFTGSALLRPRGRWIARHPVSAEKSAFSPRAESRPSFVPWANKRSPASASLQAPELKTRERKSVTASSGVALGRVSELFQIWHARFQKAVQVKVFFRQYTIDRPRFAV